VFTAHLDHLGTGEPVDGDRILNGALDNALGVAILLETARELQPEQARPRRSSLFIATAAEEHGLLGARWFVHSPTVPRGSLVANFNLDMPVLTAPSTDVVAVGAEHSTLQAVLEQAAADIGVVLTPDPYPEQAMFVRSDQFAFVRAGIPAVYLTGGVTGANRDQDPKRATAWFLRNCYHRPCDQADLPVHYGDAARLARLNARAGRIAGDAPERPRWRPGNFFGDTFGGAAGR
jgi:Zn-dependent M28 family amino/carboxypeptidase